MLGDGFRPNAIGLAYAPAAPRWPRARHREVFMRRPWLPLGVAVASFICLIPEHAVAQYLRTWVSSTGNDASLACSYTAPCKTFTGAIAKTQSHGEIDCQGPGAYGSLLITESITLDCSAAKGGIATLGANGLVINFDQFPAINPSVLANSQQTVRLRGLTLNGLNGAGSGIVITGSNTSASEVFIERCVIDGYNNGSASKGVFDQRTGGGELYVTDTTVRNISGSAIAIAPASGSTAINAILDGVRSLNSNYGLAVASGMFATVNNSVFSGHSTAGLEVDPGGTLAVNNSVSSGNGFQGGSSTSPPSAGNAGGGIKALGSVTVNNSVINANANGVYGSGNVVVDNSVISNNGYWTGSPAVFNGGAGIYTTASVRLSNSDIVFNSTGVSGTVNSFVNNRFSNNTNDGAVTAIGATSNPSGQK
jgi:hypothetical protein